MIKLMAMELISTMMELNMKDSGKMTNKMELVRKPGLMELVMLETIN